MNEFVLPSESKPKRDDQSDDTNDAGSAAGQSSDWDSEDEISLQ